MSCAIEMSVVEESILVLHKTILASTGEVRAGLYWVLVDLLQAYEAAMGAPHPVDECLPEMQHELEVA